MSVTLFKQTLSALMVGLLLLGGSRLFAQNDADEDQAEGANANAARKAEADTSADRENREKSTTPSANAQRDNDSTTRTRNGATSRTQNGVSTRPQDGTSGRPQDGSTTRTQSETTRNESDPNRQFRFDRPESRTQAGQDTDSRGREDRGRRGYNERYGNPPAPPSERDYAEFDDSRSQRSREEFDRDRNDRRFSDLDDERMDRNDRRFSNQPNERMDRRDRFRNREDEEFARDERRDFADEGRSDDRTRELGARLDVNDSGQLVIQERLSRGLLAQANIRRGDVIVSINNQPVRSQQAFWQHIRYYRDRGPIPVVILRNGTRQTVYIENTYDEYAYDDIPREYAWEDEGSAWLGVYLNARYNNSAVIQSVQRGSAADRAGLRPNDWIVSIND